MNLPIERWNDAIALRRSRRQYTGVPINEDVVANLQKTIVEFSPFNDVRAVLVTEAADEVFKGIVGSYGKVQGAPAYMAFIGKPKSPTVNENIGYLGEGLILEATALGLGTCWVGGFFKSKVVGKHISIAADEKVYAVTPVGYTTETKNFNEKMMSSMAGSHKRKEMNKIIEGGNIPTSGWLKLAVEAARIAPSAINRQPWIFNISNESNVIISVDKPRDLIGISRRLDCGIAMLHFELGACTGGVKGHWQYLPHPQVAQFLLE